MMVMVAFLRFLFFFWLFVAADGVIASNTANDTNPVTTRIRHLFTPVSITKYAKDTYIIADYSHIYWLVYNNGGWQLKFLPIVDTQQLIHHENLPNHDYRASAYNPTSVQYNEKLQRLFVANFNGHNIIEAKIAGEPPVAYVSRQFLYPELVSPENVYVDDDYTVMAVADYDASKVFLYDLAENKLRWQKSVSYAHGVLIKDDYVYVTGLAGTPESMIQQLKLEDGNSVRHFQKNANAITPLYVLSISEIPRSINTSARFAAIDANRGGILLLTDTLEIIQQIGNNGPERDSFHRPYGLYVDDDRILIADTFKNRIVVMDPDFKITDFIHFGEPIIIGNKLNYGNITPDCAYQQAPLFIATLIKKAYKLPDDVQLFMGAQILCIFQGNQFYSGALLPASMFIPSYQSQKRPLGTPLMYSWSYEFSNPQNNKLSIALIGAPDNKVLLIFDEETATYHKILLAEGLSLWMPNEDPYFLGLQKDARREIARFQAHVRTCNNNVLATYLVESLPLKNGSLSLDIKNLFAWGNREQLIQDWIAKKDLTTYFADWIQRNEKIVIEDAMMLHLLQQYPYAITTKDYQKCLQQPYTNE